MTELQENIEQLSIGEMQADNFNDLVSLHCILVAVRCVDSGLIEKAKANCENLNDVSLVGTHQLVCGAFALDSGFN